MTLKPLIVATIDSDSWSATLQTISQRVNKISTVTLNVLIKKTQPQNSQNSSLKSSYKLLKPEKAV